MSSVFESSKPISRLRRIGGGLVILAGLVLMVITFTNNLFSVSPQFEEMVDDFRPIMTEEAIESARGDLDMLADVGVEFETAIAPAMAAQLGMTNEQFVEFVAANYPDVATGLEALPVIVPTFNGLVDTLDRDRDLFESADAIPTENLPATTVPWALMAAGLGLLVAGSLMMFRPGWLGLGLAGAIGVTLVVATLVLSLFPKAADADQLNENLEPIYTQELIDQANGALVTVEAMGTQLQTEMLPDLALALGMSTEELVTFLGLNFPATAEALATMPDALGRFATMTTAFEANLDNYETIKPVAFVPIVWTKFLMGFLALFGFAIGVWDRRRNGDPLAVDRVSDLDLRSPAGKTPDVERVPERV